ncbi:hypothetical protein NKR23_g11554 [Pleurostoma richardsiae]|uniref:N-acetyltransferase domain-containing protein n=1 Tax=Pleurostoma richardsiae TaxID=41990 RepID=A0AA38VJX9_9PEZI|nr:hypothetical protein NKR23_g11554 [Pleurostoma richardsiae]
MPSPSFNLRPGRPEDVAQMCEIYFDAFGSSIPTQTCFPPSSKQAHEFWQKSLGDEIHDPTARFLVVEDTSTTPATAVAFAKWNAPDAPFQPLPDLDAWPADGNPQVAAEFFGKLWELHEQIMGRRPHWYLELIATRAGYQGKGAGGMLIRWGTDRADEEGLESYLDATPEGKPVYERYGFRELETLRFFGGKYAQCFMIRDVKTRK